MPIHVSNLNGSPKQHSATASFSSTPESDTQSVLCSGSLFDEEWPASSQAMSAARTFLRDCASAQHRTLLLPDKDADGLCSGLILYRTLLALGIKPDLLSVHFVAKGSNVHADDERARIAAYNARYIIVSDQGSRPGPAIVDDPKVKALIIDHHVSNEFPESAQVLSAAHKEPIATSSTLAYLLCLPLVPSTPSHDMGAQLDYLCVIGTMGDLGTAHRWDPPFPDMQSCLKQWTKKALGEAVSLINAPRRTARYDVLSAWNALLSTSSPRELIALSSSYSQRLHQARKEVRFEVDRCAHTAPTFSGDGRVALIRIESAAQVHPLIATRWASTLKSARLEVVMCANSSYLEGRSTTNFSCRVARCATNRAVRKGQNHSGINIIEMLKSYAGQVPGLRESMGEDFARGHKQASGGIVRTADFERLWEIMSTSKAEMGEDDIPRKKRRTGDLVDRTPGQNNTLDRWLKTS